MEAFTENPGLRHIGEKILGNLDFKTQLSCRLVNKSWYQILEDEAEKSKIDLNDMIESILQSMTPSDENRKSPRIEFERLSTATNWFNYVLAVFSKVYNPWISIYLQKHIKYQIKNGFPSYTLEYFVLHRHVKMVDFILKENLHQIIKDATTCEPIFDEVDFNQALKLAIENKDIEIVDCLKNLTIAA